jgi:N-methylhydantoinase B
VLTLRRGDRLVMESSLAGGFGDPFDRDPVLILCDLLDGFLKKEIAETAYGVSDLRRHR